MYLLKRWKEREFGAKSKRKRGGYVLLHGEQDELLKENNIFTVSNARFSREKMNPVEFKEQMHS